ncbi:dnaJ protein homolog ANJ1-like [Lotus japonicus]|uniref:dnaJ protein homolog ANJ1-like n=1 Tax=Lotus japonicus TaxID=34305 RepID=UPI002587E18E|nr:dnaJ protein homolog ANJ1-like [Lotus japonicus]
MVGSTICCLCKQYKSIIKRWFSRKKSSSSSKDNNPQRQNQTEQEHDAKNGAGATMNGIHSFRLKEDALRDKDFMMSLKGCCLCRHRSLDDSSFPSTASLARKKSRKVTRARSKSRESYDFTPTTSSLNNSGNLRLPPHVQSRSVSRRSSTPIMYSNSSGRLKPPPIEKKLECTLEELCYGCKKNIKITRDVITDTGEIVQEEELLTINVQPGWKKGTKIKFEGKGNDRPNAYREDIVFFISEKRHQLFRREEDDLELGVEIPLLKALTGCTISVPLLGGEQMKLRVDDVIYPGFEKIITGQGMPITKEPENRGNLRITFLVEFPKKLTENQRSEVFDILQDSS